MSSDTEGGVLDQLDHGHDTASLYDTILGASEDPAGTYLPHQDTTVDLDTYVQQVVAVQFDEEHGAPYWREMHGELKDEYGADFDIRDAVADEGYAAVRKYLPEADEAALKRRPMTDFLPSVYDPQDIDISKSSGTTGQKKVMPWSKHVSDAAVDWYDWNLDRYDVEGGDWLVCGPYGLYEKHLEGAANSRGGFAYFSGIETREVKKQLGALKELTEDPVTAIKDPRTLPGKVKDAVQGITRMSPTLTVLEEDLETEPVSHIASAPAVVEQLYDVLDAEHTVSDPADIETILVSGAAVTDESVAGLNKQYENADIVPMYATSFTGPAFGTADSTDITYYPMAPAVHMEVVDEETRELVEYGERGQVELNRIGPDFFWPNQTERETAVRLEPTDEFDWSGIADVQPLQE